MADIKLFKVGQSVEELEVFGGGAGEEAADAD